jgi:D-serine deaminase-like pyridoxal phosphate-dependent protein
MTALATAEPLFVSPSSTVDTPALIVDEPTMRRNIAEMAAFAASVEVTLRPHIKTHKTPRITRLQMAAGAVGITCAKLGEAEVMVEQAEVGDVLMAYPVVGPAKITRLLALMERARMIVALDDREVGEAIGRAVAAQDRSIDVYVEVNSGGNRAGALVGDDAVALALDLARISGLRVVGIMTHEGHANSAEPDALRATALSAGRAMVETAERLREHGLDIQTVSVGSTPASLYTPTVPGITEMRPGTYVFNDNSEFRHGRVGPANCALRILSTVVSRPAPERALLDAGSKTLAMDPSRSHPGHGYIVGHADAIISKLSEEHGFVQVPDGMSGLSIGDRVEIIPNHVCPTVNLQDELFVVRDGELIDRWAVAARGKVR